jgi:uncharacterized protein (UPF0261 family)
MISCGPIERRDTNDPLWRERKLTERAISVPDRFRVEARTTADEVAEIGRLVASKLNQSKGPVTVVVPTKGWSSLSEDDTDLHDPEADAAFIPALREKLDPRVVVQEVPKALNMESFGRYLAATLDEMIREQAGEARDS